MARVLEGGEIAGINGFMHMIDNVLIYEPDLRAKAVNVSVSVLLLLFHMLVLVVFAFRL